MARNRPYDPARCRAYYQANREVILEKARAYRAEHCERINAKVRECTARNKTYYRKKGLASKYGLTLEQYEALFTKHAGCCANGKVTRLGVDHDHKTGQVRGLLCTPCNTSLGGFRDNPALLEAAIQYLQGGQ